MAKPDIAFVGLGAMGFGMATHLVKQGYAVTGFDVWAPTLERFVAAGGRTATTPAAAVVDKPVVVVMVATAQQAQAVLIEGAEPAYQGLANGAVVLLCSTVPAGYVQGLAGQLADPAGPVNRPDVVLIDCPVSGGAARAADGTLSIMAGADDGALADNTIGRAILAELADPQKLYVVPGGIGAGSNTKMVHQVLAINQITASAEAMGLAVRLGAQPDAATLQTLMASQGASWMLGHRGPRMADFRFEPLASATVIAAKDAGIITSEARRSGFTAPLTGIAENRFHDAVARGLGAVDDSALLKLYTDGRENAPAATGAPDLQLVVNLLKGIHLAAAAEALAFAHHVGLDLDLVLSLCIDAAGGTAVLEAHGPSIVKALQSGTAATGWAVEGDVESLEPVFAGLTATLEAAQEIKAPVYLGTEALSLIGLALRSIGTSVKPAAGSLVKVWA